MWPDNVAAKTAGQHAERNDLSGQEIRVQALHTIEDLEQLRMVLGELNLSSRRPCAFSTFEYIRSLARHDEHARPGDRLLALAAFRGERLIGYVALRGTLGRALGVSFRSIGMLVAHDTDRPHVVARAEDELACCTAFYRYLAAHERWSVLEFAYQDAESKLWPVELPASRFSCRRFENQDAIEIPLRAGTLAEFFRALPADFRNTVGRMTRRLFGAGCVETVSVADPRASRELLDLYLDLERRSWKVGTSAGITRHPKRIDFFRSLCEPDQQLKLAYDFIMLDSVPICAMISGAFADRFYAFETTYDQAYAELSPGYLTWLMAIRHGIMLGLRSYNMQSGYGYYKERWGGTSTPTWAVQVYRVPSLPHLKSLLGALKRKVIRPRRERVLANELKRAAGPGARPPTGVVPDRTNESALATRILKDLAQSGVPFERLAAQGLAEVLPFDVKQKMAQGGGKRNAKSYTGQEGEPR